jgi:ADP-heptose:LPS heptosyltransferase
LFPSRSIQDVVSVINRATLVISPDTAIVHIAAAFDKPLFALYNGLENFYTKFYPLCSEKCIIKANSKEDSIENIPTEIAISQFKEFIKKYL